MIQNKLYILFMLGLWLNFLPAESSAQQKKQKNKKETSIIIKAKLVDENGAPIQNALITSGEGAVSTYSKDDGSFEISSTAGGIVMIQANGFENAVINLDKEPVTASYILEKRPLFSSSNDLVEFPMGITIPRRSIVGAVNSINGKVLERYGDVTLSNALQGQLAGLTVRPAAGRIGNNGAELYIRGLSRGNSDGALTIVDGIERPIDDLLPQEIEQVEVLKDATSKILYGPMAANGVILITTKRGKANTRVINVSGEYGAMMASRMPDFLNAYDYALLYNEARQNDGLLPFYSEADLLGYKNSSGANDQRYPDVNYYDYFLRDAMPFSRANLEFSGGNEQTQYALITGYTGAKGIETISTPAYDRFNLRGNLNLRITPSLSAFAGIAGIIGLTNSGDINSGQIFTKLSSHRPNEYPFVIDNEELAAASKVLGEAYIPPLGGSLLYPDNLYGRLLYGGNQLSQNFIGQGNFGLNLKLDKIAKGLGAKAYFSFDNYQTFTRGKTEDPVTYGQRWFTDENGQDTAVYYQLQKKNIQADQVRRGHGIERRLGWIGNLNYNRSSNEHDFSSDLSYFYYRREADGTLQDVENLNLSLRGAYSYQKKYYLEASMAYMGSNRFASKNRYFLSPAAGIGWVLSEENFLRNSSINFLKLKGSFGVLGYDRATSFYLFESRWFDNGDVRFNERNQNRVPRTSIDLIGNPDLKWEKSREINIGLEGLALNQRLQFDLNYFDELRYDIIMKPRAEYTALHGGLFPFTNYGRTSNSGVDGSISWNQTAGDFRFGIGGNFIYQKNKILKTDEDTSLDPYLKQTGRPSDAYFNYVSQGLFTSQQEVDAHPFQSLGNYGVGDIKYADLNNDGIIDPRDRKMIGNSFPRTTLGININLHYKGFGLYALGTSELGVDRMLNNSYYWNYGEGKYSSITKDRWHKDNNPDGTYPRLTTTDGSNNFTGSTFWLEDASFFRLKNVELSYTLKNAVPAAKNCRFYLRGSNLLVVSKIKDLDPEVNNGGISNYPVFRTVTGGVSFTF